MIEPASGRLWSAALGGGATCDGRPLRVSGATDVALSLLATGFSYSAERRTRQVAMIGGLLPHVRDVRRAGSAALDLCAVAAGWVDAYVEHGCNWWDWAAAALIAAEAGAVVRVPGPTGSAPPDDGLGRRRAARRDPGDRRRAGRRWPAGTAPPASDTRSRAARAVVDRGRRRQQVRPRRLAPARRGRRSAAVRARPRRRRSRRPP